MTSAQTEEESQQKPLRLWPGVVIVALQSVAWFVLPVVVPAAGAIGAFAALGCGLAFFVWWAFFSRAPRTERWGGLFLMIGALAATPRVLHESIARGGMGMLFFVYALPILCLAFVGWAVAARRLRTGPRRATMVATILLACGAWAFLRTDGTIGGGSEFAWRWTETSEERLLARGGEVPIGLTSPAVELAAEADWPGFRGPARDGVVRAGVAIETDWSVSPPAELWRRPVGPGWSSFAVQGSLVYTQEQRGEEEVVSCHDVTTGDLVWRHSDPTRFWESNGGAGPRATPTLSDGRLYSLGATGVLNALDAADGSVAWSRDLVTDAGAKIPIWGFSSSPLVIDDLVVVAAAGQLVAYDLATGEPRWLGSPGAGYSSPHRLTIDGVEQILMLGDGRVAAVAAADGTLLWEHAWSGGAIVQPNLTGDGDVLIGFSGMSGGVGIRRLAVARSGGMTANAELSDTAGWTAEERWTSNGLKPYFSDFVVHDGHAYGFDGRILACIDLEDGERRWKGGRYGNGQLVLLADTGLLLVLSEKGELALVEASPDGFTELARVQALEGKTWNHPVLVDDLLLVRNGREMAAFRLARAGG
jgi:outer membrane protein assembly factor BamB